MNKRVTFANFNQYRKSKSNDQTTHQTFLNHNNQLNKIKEINKIEETKQQIQYINIQNGFYSFHYSQNQNYCLTLSQDFENNQNDQQTIKYEECTRNQNQIFYVFQHQSTQTYSIIPLLSNKCIGVDFPQCEEETQIICSLISLENNWKWKFVQTSQQSCYQLEIQSNKMRMGFNKNTGNYTNSNITLNKSHEKENTFDSSIEDHCETFFINQYNYNDIRVIEWLRYINKIEEVIEKTEFIFSPISNMVIDNKTVEIEKQIFKCVSTLFFHLKKVTIPFDIKNIEEGSFDHLELEEISCSPELLKHFVKHKNTLHTIIITNNTKEIMKEQLQPFESIKRLIIPYSVTKMESCFTQYTLDSMQINPILFQDWQFLGMHEIIVPDGVNEIKASYFKRANKFESLKLPTTLKTIEEKTFSKINSLKKLECPSWCLKYFKSADLTTYIVSNKTTEIVKDSLKFCQKISNFVIPSSVKTIDKIDITKYLKRVTNVTCDCKLLPLFQGNILKSISIPYGIHEIKSDYFNEQIEIQEIHLPNTISICDPLTFAKCHNLTKVECSPKNLKYFKTLQLKELIITDGVSIIKKENFESLNFESLIQSISLPTTLTKIEEGTFELFVNLKQLIIDPKWIKYFKRKIDAEIEKQMTQKEIDEYEELVESIQELIIPEGVEKIKRIDMKLCGHLTKIKIPKSVQIVENETLEICSNLKVFDCETKWYKYISIEEYTIPENTKIIQKGIYNGWKMVHKFIIPSSVEKIEKGSFENCLGLMEVKIETKNKSSNLRRIEENAFKNCENLQTINIPDDTHYVDITAFEGCPNVILDCSNKLKKTLTTKLKIEDNTDEIQLDDYDDYENVDKLIIPITINISQPENFFPFFKRLKYCSFDPKYLPMLKTQQIDLKNQLKVFIIPNEVKQIKRTYFEGCSNIEVLEIPNSINNFEKNSFKDLTKVNMLTCSYDHIKYFNKQQLKTVIIHDYGVKDKDIFKECINLENVIVPDECSEHKDTMFEKCKKLKIIQYLSGKKDRLRTKLIVDSTLTILNQNQYEGIENVGELTIPLSVKEINRKTFSKMNEIEQFHGDPKWLTILPRFKITEIYIPKEINVINEDYFKGCINLKTLHFEGTNVRFIGNRRYEFSNIQIFNCTPEILKNLSLHHANKMNLREVHFNEETIEIPSHLFNGFDKVEEIVLPESLQIIKSNAIENLLKIERLFIPDSIHLIETNAIFNCPYLKTIRCPLKFLKCIPKENILEITLTQCDRILQKDDFEHFDTLESLILPENVKEVPDKIFEKCPNLMELSCSASLLENMGNDQIKLFKIIHFPYEKIIKKEITNYLSDIYDIKINYGTDMSEFDITETFGDNQQKETDINDLKKFDKRNEQYVGYIEKIQNHLNDISIESSSKSNKVKVLKESKETNLQQNPSPIYKTTLEDITNIMIEVFSEIYKRSEDHRKPYTVQCLTILRLLDEILNGAENNTISKGCVAEVKTGEGKTFIIAVVAIILQKYYGRVIDIVTSNIELATRDQNEQQQYFNLFGIKNGVLYNAKNDKEFMPKKLKEKIDKSSTYNSKVFSFPIVYSTNSNFEGVYLESLFRKESLRMMDKEKLKNKENTQKKKINFTMSFDNDEEEKEQFEIITSERPYDVVIIDEVDNMLIDQQSQPSILSRNHNIEYSKDILQIVYLLQREDIEDIKNVLEYYFKGKATFNIEVVKKLKHAAQTALMLEKGVDYIVETIKEEIEEETETKYKTLISCLIDIVVDVTTGKKYRKVQKVIIIDPNTGYKKPGNRWENYIHEMVEVKENVDVKPPTIAYCCIPQRTFFGKYTSICGVTGTIGDNKDRKILTEQYKVKLFKVPRHKAPKKIIYERQRPKTFEEMKYELSKEIMKERNRGRPVLVILDSINRVDEMSMIFPDAGVIKGINPENEREVIKYAGEAEALTIATLAAGRGMDIKLSKRAREVGGLHVIVPYLLPNVRALEQAIGRSGRQGQHGTATVYIDQDDKYEPSIEFHETHKYLNDLQEDFSKYLHDKYPWIYKEIVCYIIQEKYNFGMTIDELIVKLRDVIVKRKYTTNDFQLYQNYVHEMIMISWGSFYSNIATNLDDYRSEEKCRKEYNEFITILEQNIPKEFESPKELVKAIGKKAFGILDNKDTQEKLLEKINSVVSGFFGPIVGATITIAGGLLLSGGFDIIKQLRKTGKVNWWHVFASASKGALIGSLQAFDITSTFADLADNLFDKITNDLLDISSIGDIVENFNQNEEKYLFIDEMKTISNLLSETMMPQLEKFSRSKDDAELANQVKNDIFKLRIGNTRFRKFAIENREQYEEPIDLLKDLLSMYKYMNECRSKLQVFDLEDPLFEQKMKNQKSKGSVAVGFRRENKIILEKFILFVLEENDVKEERRNNNVNSFDSENVKLINSVDKIIDDFGGFTKKNKENMIKGLTKTKIKTENDIARTTNETKELQNDFNNGIIKEEEYKKRLFNNKESLDQLQEELTIMKIQLGGVEYFQKVIQQVKDEKLSIDKFEQITAIMGFGLISITMKNKINDFILYFKGEIEIQETPQMIQRRKFKETKRKNELIWKRQLNQIEEICNLEYSHTLFDTERNAWSQKHSEFNGLIDKKSQLVFLMDDRKDNVFGVFVNNKIIMNEKKITEDPNAFMFTLPRVGTKEEIVKLSFNENDSKKVFISFSESHENLFKISDCFIIKKKEERNGSKGIQSKIASYATKQNLPIQPQTIGIKRIRVLQMHRTEYSIEKKEKEIEDNMKEYQAKQQKINDWIHFHEKVFREKYQREIIHLENWFNLKFSEILFTSEKHDWSTGSSQFDGIIFGKSNLVFLIEDYQGNLFGTFTSEKVEKYQWTFGMTSYGEQHEDKSSKIFVLREHNKFHPSLSKFKTKSKKALSLAPQESSELFRFGGRDIVIKKKENKQKCSLMSDCHSVSSSLFFMTREFNVKKITVLQMKEQNEFFTDKMEKENNYLKDLNDKYQTTKPIELQQVEKLTETKFQSLLFDSDVCFWGIGCSSFSSRIIRKKSLVFLIEDTKNNIFGAYIETPITQEIQFQNNLMIGSVDDKQALIFSLKSNGRYQNPLKFEIQYNYSKFACQLFNIFDERLITFGGLENDIVLYKYEKRNCSYSKQTAFVYPKRESLVGCEGNENPFELKRIQVFEMNQNDQRNKQQNEVDSKWKPIVEKLFDKKYDSTIFDSLRNEWSIGQSLFHQSILNKSNIAIIIEDREGNIFGAYIESRIEELLGFINGKLLGSSNTDRNSFIFTLYSNGRIQQPMKFPILQSNEKWGIQLYDQNAEVLFSIGGGDICIFKENLKDKCYCEQISFNYSGNKNTLIGREGKQFPFTVNRIQVWKMEDSEEQKQMKTKECEMMKKQIQQITECPVGDELFNSDKHSWQMNRSYFDKMIFGKSDIAIIIEDQENNAFGIYLENSIDNYQFLNQQKQHDGMYNSDSHAFIFTLKSKGHFISPSKYPIIQEKKDLAFSLRKQEDSLLFVVGESDIVIQKKFKYDECYCIPKSFNYNGTRNALIGKEGRNNPFSVKRIIVYQLLDNQEKMNIDKEKINHYVKQIEMITQMTFEEILFDSKIHDWSVNNSKFDDVVMNHSLLAILIEDTKGNVFGGFIENKVDSYFAFYQNKWLGYRISDKHSMIFSLSSNNRYEQPVKFIIKSENRNNAFELPQKQHGELFRFGKTDFIVFKKEYKHLSTLQLTQYNMEGKQNLIISSNPQEITFTPKRIQVIQMKMNDELKNERLQQELIKQQQMKQMYDYETTQLKDFERQTFGMYMDHLKIIEEWNGMVFKQLLFHSDYCNWNQYTSTFDQRIFEKENIVIFIEDSNKNLFGGFVHRKIDGIYKQENNIIIPHSINDAYTFIFSINSNNRLTRPTQFKIIPTKSNMAFRLMDQSLNNLFIFGDDIFVGKKNRANESCCIQQSFDYGQRKSILVGETPSINCGNSFIPTKIVVFELQETEQHQRIVHNQHLQIIGRFINRKMKSLLYDCNNYQPQEGLPNITESIYKQSQIVILIEDSNENVFGGYFPQQVTNLYTPELAQTSPVQAYNHDQNTLLFSISSNRRLIVSTPFSLLPNCPTFSFTVFPNNYPIVCMFGNNDLVIKRDRTGTVCKQSFDYKNVQHPLVVLNNDGIGNFMIKRIRIYEFE